MASERKRSPVVEIEPDARKIVESIAFVIAEAERRCVPVTQYDIVKTLFFADRSHLNRYGRPVIFDNYVAMGHGPVPSLAYDFLKQRAVAMKRHGLPTLPWKQRSAPDISPSAELFFDAKKDIDENILAESDADALRDALTTVKSLTFGQIRVLTHNDPAYMEAWDEDGAKNSPISYGLLFDSPDFEQAELIDYMSRQTIDKAMADRGYHGQPIQT